MEAATRIGQGSASLTRAERRVAEVVLEQPQLVAFGTVADLARAAGSGAATVVRLATKLGFDGFTALQASVQHDLAHQLRPAAVRIREAAGGSVEHHLRLETENVHATLEGANAEVLAAVIAAVSRLSGSVRVLSGDASLGVAQQFVGDLSALRPGVAVLDGNAVRIERELSLLGPGDVVVALDLRRYDRWVIETVRAAVAADVTMVAISDSLLSPLAEVAEHTLVVAAAGVGPFDSHVGTLALFNLIIAGAAEQLRDTAADRLERAEAAWSRSDALIER